MKKRLRIIAALLSAMLALSFSACIFIYTTPKYSDRKYSRPDEAHLTEMLDDYLSYAEKKADDITKKELNAVRTSLFEALYDISTCETLATINNNLNGKDEYWAGEYAYIETYSSSFKNELMKAEKVLFGTDYHDFLVKQTSEKYAEYILNYDASTEEQLALMAHVNDLTAQFGTLDPSSDPAKTAALYIDMIKTRNAYARTYNDANGVPYKNYIDFAYANLYGRDYSPDDAAVFSDAVMKYFVPLKNALGTQSSGIDSPLDEQHLRSYTRRIIEATAEDMTAPWDYMISHDLYDFSYSDDKTNTSFVIDFMQYGDGFMFINPNNSLCYDLLTVLHEFGHYNAVFAEDPKKSQGLNISNYDLLETHSQCFALLTLPAVKEIIDEKYYKRYTYTLFTNNVAWTALSNCMFDEFERTVYAADENHLNEAYLNNAFSTVKNKYWKETRYNYYDITHFFYAPAYCISYAVSLILSAEIWGIGGNASVSTYQDLVSYGSSCSLSYVTDACGLKHPLLADSVFDAAAAIRGTYVATYGTTYELIK